MKVVVPKETHMDFYDKLDYVDPAVKDASGEGRGGTHESQIGLR